MERVGRVRSVEPPDAAGQWLVVEERPGIRWRVQTLGAPVEVGARVSFQALGGLGRSAEGRRDVAVAASRQGQLLRVLDAPTSTWVCTLRRRRGRAELVPFGGMEAPPLRLVGRGASGAEEGDRVVVAADEGGRRRSGGRRRGPRRADAVPVRVREVLGPAGEPDADHRALVWKYDLPSGFPRRARREAEAVDPAVDPRVLRRRRDLRALPFVTIDPASARDHDDAVFAERASDPEGEGGARPRGEGWHRRLWVAIADVAHFVEEGGALDSEARRRGNSFYFPDRAIPMLPERLSADACSLRADVDRLAMVVELRLAADGRVVDAHFHEAVIRSRAGLAYEEVADWLAKEAAGGAGTEPAWAESLRCLDGIASDLLRRRREAGAVLLELPEASVEVDASGRPVDCRMRERSRAHVLIEEAMLAANRAVAEALHRAGCCTLQRVHAPPAPQKWADLAELLERLGLAGAREIEDPRVLARLLEEVRGTPSEERVHTAALRAMSQARYRAEEHGHFALQFADYVHFTSPIRRYADLDVHRALKRRLRGAVDPAEERERRLERATRLGIWLSARERVAIDVEREAQAFACCVLLQGREGERFAARVVGVSEFGVFVRLASPAATGLVPMRLLDGEWDHDPEEEVLVGPRSGARIALGDEIDVELANVDLDRGRIALRRTMDGRAPTRPRGSGRRDLRERGSRRGPRARR